MLKNLDLFGGEVCIPEKPKGRRKTPTMQEMFGIVDGKTCGSCDHCYSFTANRKYYKCELWMQYFPGGGHSASTDIRLRNTACGKWKGGTDDRVEKEA